MARQIQKSLKPSETENFKLLIHAGDRNTDEHFINYSDYICNKISYATQITPT